MRKELGPGGEELWAESLEQGAGGVEFGVKDMANIIYSDNQLFLGMRDMAND